MNDKDLQKRVDEILTTASGARFVKETVRQLYDQLELSERRARALKHYYMVHDDTRVNLSFSKNAWDELPNKMKLRLLHEAAWYNEYEETVSDEDLITVLQKVRTLRKEIADISGVQAKLETAKKRIAELEEDNIRLAEGIISGRIGQLERENKRLDAALAQAIDHYEDAKAGDCAMDTCAETIIKILKKARAGE